MDKWICDVRSGCVAIYKGEPVNCIESVNQADLALELMGTYNEGKAYWELPYKYVAKAQRVCELLNELTARAEAAEARADAAIADLNHLTHAEARCEICKHYLDEECITCEFEWRGPEAGKGENA